LLRIVKQMRQPVRRWGDGTPIWPSKQAATAAMQQKILLIQ
jgi:hypothetical protein